MDPEQIIQHIKQQNNVNLNLIHKYEMGEQGAYEVKNEKGQEYVLKFSKGDNTNNLLKTKKAIQLLKDKDYPVADYSLISKTNDYTYSLQTKLPGKPFQKLNHELLDQIIKLNKLQQNIDFADNQNWTNEIIKTVLEGGEGYCDIISLREYSVETANMLHQLQGFVNKNKNANFIKTDIVHFDFSGSNILVEDNIITGVIDWEGVSSGDCTFDLVELFFYHYLETDFKKILLNEINNRIDQNILKIYLAHMIIRQVDWSIRFHNDDVIKKYIDLSQKIVNANFNEIDIII